MNEHVEKLMNLGLHEIVDFIFEQDAKITQQEEIINHTVKKEESYGIELELLNDEIVRLEKKNKHYREALEEIETLTRSPYEPSIYMLNYIARNGLEGENNE